MEVDPTSEIRKPIMGYVVLAVCVGVAFAMIVNLLFFVSGNVGRYLWDHWGFALAGVLIIIFLKMKFSKKKEVPQYEY